MSFPRLVRRLVPPTPPVGATQGRRAQLLGSALHPIRKSAQFAGRIPQRGALALVARLVERRRPRLLFQIVLQPAHALGKPRLLSGQPAQGVLAGIAWRDGSELARDLPLAIGELSGFEAQIPKNAPTRHQVGTADAAADRAAFQCPAAARAGVLRRAPSQVAGGLTHLLRHIMHLLTVALVAPASGRLTIGLGILPSTAA